MGTLVSSFTRESIERTLLAISESRRRILDGAIDQVAMDHDLHPTDEQYAQAIAQTESDQMATEPLREEILN